mmetsp:Transcript_14058/g.34827  ORF Transcript_14058/g.34827 Transcript_14058/m.34827 type:complete len:221 (-) Transcript_14058:1698-2360(-)
MEKSLGRMRKSWTLQALLMTIFGSLFTASMACFTYACTFASLIAAVKLVTPGLTFSASPSSSSVPGSSPVAPLVLSVTKMTLYFFLSPTIITLEIAVKLLLIQSSIGTGATFSPPAVMISSLYRPVMRKKPSLSMQALSPESIQPSGKIASAFFFFTSCRCSSPRSGLARYPIMMWRPRKHSSPCSCSVGADRSLHGPIFFSPFFRSIVFITQTSTPGGQ